MMLIMPLVLTAILGSALKGVMGGEPVKMNLGVYTADTHELTAGFIQNVLKSSELKESIELKTADSENELKNWLKDEKIGAGLFIPVEWGKQLQDGESAEATVYAANGKDIEAAFAKQLADAYAKSAQTIAISTKLAVSNLAAEAMAQQQPFDAEATARQFVQDMKGTATEADFVKDVPVGKKSVSSMQYYAAAMAAMFLLFNAMVAGKSFHIEKATETLSRMMAAPLSARTVLAGKFLGTLFFAICQFSIFMTATHYFLGVNWGDNLLQTLAIAFAFSFAVSGLGMVVASLTRDEKMADVAGNMGVQVFAILGGSMLPLTVFPAILKKISLVTPNSWALTSFTNIMGGADWNSLFIPITVLIGMGILAGAAGTWGLRAKY